MNVESEGQKRGRKNGEEERIKKEKEKRPKWIGGGNETIRSSPFRAGHQLIIGANQSTACPLGLFSQREKKEVTLIDTSERRHTQTIKRKIKLELSR